MSDRAIVAGGGIGGLAAAVGLLRSGWQVTVLEAAPDFTEVGSGFALTPNGLTAMTSLGPGTEAASISAPLTMEGARDPRGRWIMRLDADRRPDDLRLYGIHRQRLHRLLLSAAHGADLRRSAVVRAVDPGGLPGERACVRFDEQGAARSLEADLVVGADGIRSTVRRSVDAGVRVRYSGMSSWRGVVDDDGLVGDRFTMSWGPGAEFGALRIGAGQTYWYGYVRLAERTRFPDERAAALDRFHAWAEPIPQLIAATDPSRLLRHDVYTLSPPARRIVTERVVLLGDAAHAMLPTMGQGVNTTLEDAATLAGLLRPGELVEGIARYSSERFARTRRIQRQSALTARFGSHLSSPVAVAIRNGLLRLTPDRRLGSTSKALFDWRPPVDGLL